MSALLMELPALDRTLLLVLLLLLLLCTDNWQTPITNIYVHIYIYISAGNQYYFFACVKIQISILFVLSDKHVRLFVLYFAMYLLVLCAYTHVCICKLYIYVYLHIHTHTCIHTYTKQKHIWLYLHGYFSLLKYEPKPCGHQIAIIVITLLALKKMNKRQTLPILCCFPSGTQCYDCFTCIFV